MILRSGCLLAIWAIFNLLLVAQISVAGLTEDGHLIINEIPKHNYSVTKRDTPTALYTMMPGFPRPFKADPAFKNFRNITLADINDDGYIDILGATGSTLWAWSYPDTILWSQPLLGTPIYPPSVADLDGDNDLEIALNTAGGAPSNGKVYLFDHTGQLLQGWPKNFNNNLMLLAPTLADVDGLGNLEVVTIERVSGGGSFLHVLNESGIDLPGWPAFFPNTLAVTPSVADLDRDGLQEIIIATTRELYVLDHTGLVKPGWPKVNTELRFSYQSPITADIDDDGDLEIIGSTNGDNPEFYILHHTGDYINGWPIKVPDQNWTYSTPSLLLANNNYNIFMGRPLYNDEAQPMLFNTDAQGEMQHPFPLIKTGGSEGLITLADINDDGTTDVILESNRLEDEKGFIHAYDLSTLTELQGFPLRPRGWTYMNGACVADINNDGWTELIFLSYTEHLGTVPDTAFLNIYTSKMTFHSERVFWNTYKGNNTRDGHYIKDVSSKVSRSSLPLINLFPNPVYNDLHLLNQHTQPLNIQIYDQLGRRLMNTFLYTELNVDVRHFHSGYYFIYAQLGPSSSIYKFYKA